MANPPEEKKEQKKKKKRGFLGYLWILFWIFIVILVAGAGIFYWQGPAATAWLLDKYTCRLADVMTSAAHYQIADDQQYRQEAEGKEKSPDASLKTLQEKILTAHREEAKATFLGLVKAYKDSPTKEWYPALKNLDRQLKEIFRDQKVSPLEFQNFIAQVKKVTKQFQIKESGETDKTDQ